MEDAFAHHDLENEEAKAKEIEYEAYMQSYYGAARRIKEEEEKRDERIQSQEYQTPKISQQLSASLQRSSIHSRSGAFKLVKKESEASDSEMEIERKQPKRK